MQAKHTWLRDHLHLVGGEFTPLDVVMSAHHNRVPLPDNTARWAHSQIALVCRDGNAERVAYGRYRKLATARVDDQTLIGVPVLGEIPPEMIERALEHLMHAGRSLSRALNHATPGTAAEEYLLGCLRTHGEQAGMLRTMMEATPCD